MHPLLMFICVTSAAIKNPSMNVGTMCVKYVVTNTPKTAIVPSISSTVNRTSATARYLQGAKFLRFTDAMKNCAAIIPAIIASIAAANCVMPYIQSYVVRIQLTSL